MKRPIWETLPPRPVTREEIAACLSPAFADTIDKTIWAKVPTSGYRKEDYGALSIGDPNPDDPKELVDDLAQDPDGPFDAFAVFDRRVHLVALADGGRMAVDDEPVDRSDGEFGEFVGGWDRVESWHLSKQPGTWHNVANATPGGRSYMTPVEDGLGNTSQRGLPVRGDEAASIREDLFEERMKAIRETDLDLAVEQAKAEAMRFTGTVVDHDAASVTLDDGDEVVEAPLDAVVEDDVALGQDRTVDLRETDRYADEDDDVLHFPDGAHLEATFSLDSEGSELRAELGHASGTVAVTVDEHRMVITAPTAAGEGYVEYGLDLDRGVDYTLTLSRSGTELNATVGATAATAHKQVANDVNVWPSDGSDTGMNLLPPQYGQGAEGGDLGDGVPVDITLDYRGAGAYRVVRDEQVEQGGAPDLAPETRMQWVGQEDPRTAGAAGQGGRNDLTDAGRFNLSSATLSVDNDLDMERANDAIRNAISKAAEDANERAKKRAPHDTRHRE